MGRLSDIRTTEWLLVNWGRWAYANRGLSLEYPGMGAIERMRGSALPEPLIEDSDALVIDYLVSCLKQIRPAEHDALVLHYLCGFSYRRIGRYQRRHHRDVANMVHSGAMWIEGALQGPDQGFELVHQ